MATGADLDGMDEAKVSTDLRAAMFLGDSKERYAVVVRLADSADAGVLGRYGYGPGRLGADWRTVGLDLGVGAVAELSRQPWVQSVSLSHRYRPLSA